MSDNPLDVQVGGEHYKSCKIQPVEFIEANGLGFLEGCVVKRLARHEKPTGKGRQDIEKAIHELQLLLQLRYSEVPTHPDGTFIGRGEPAFVVNPAPAVDPRWFDGYPDMPTWRSAPRWATHRLQAFVDAGQLWFWAVQPEHTPTVFNGYENSRMFTDANIVAGTLQERPKC